MGFFSSVWVHTGVVVQYDEIILLFLSVFLYRVQWAMIFFSQSALML